MSSPSPVGTSPSPSVVSSPSVSPPSFPPTADPSDPPVIPGTIAPDLVTIEVEVAVDDQFAGTFSFFGDIAVDDDLGVQAIVAEGAGVTFVTVDVETGIEIDRGTTDDAGRVTLDAEYDAPFYVAVAGTDQRSDGFQLAAGESVSLRVVQYVGSGTAPSDVPTTEPTTPPTTAPAVDPTVAPASGTGTVTLPNTGTGSSAPASATMLLLALAAGACVALGATGLLRGRRS